MLASPTAAGMARTLTNARLHKWGYTHLSDDAFLVASELITNAVTATPGSEIKYQLSRDGGEVLLAVWDSSTRVPAPRPIPPVELSLETLDLAPERWDDNGGWGIPIVATLSVSSGYTLDPQGGKWVWARLKP
ncbi:ATP-binding protein [Actinomadura viridis]|uniref:Anti-sigma regulatory factor (Ser/Thr protein kinase) n=1 Tax=Actinomadura viridis TaxID=58110 RepID=A0A931DK18_9ACTN|nr:ATP-binding protein [Actinomadura viridis]MBG6089532.1 anti-sigma regulatory factor (Ser/Thr protein kinase) [Actinomadura viridis]